MQRLETSLSEGLALLVVTAGVAASLLLLPPPLVPTSVAAGGVVLAGLYLRRPLLVLLCLLALYPFYMVVAALFLSKVGGLAGTALSGLKEILLVGLFGVVLLRNRDPVLSEYRAVWRAIAAFAAMLLVMVVLTPASTAAALQSARFHLTYLLLLPVGVALVRSDGAVRQVLHVVLASALVAAVGWLSVLGWVGLGGLSYAAATTRVIFSQQEFGDPINVLGTYMAIMVCLALGCAEMAPGGRWRIALYSLTGLLGWALLTTFSRRSIMAAVLGAFIIGWLGRRWRVLAAGAVAGVVVVAFGSVYLLRRLSISYAADHGGTRARLYHLRYTLENLDPLSLVVGHGMGTAGHVAVAAGTEGAVDLHNYYLLLLFETGLIGLGLYLIVCWWVFRRLRLLAMAPIDGWAWRGAVLGTLGAFPAFLATGMFGIGNAVLPNAPLIWTLAGASLAAIGARAAPEPVAARPIDTD